MRTTDDRNDVIAEDDESMDPRRAAALIEDTERAAHRQLEMHSPLLALVRAGLFFVGFGAIWLSTRHQHPYVGPTGAALMVLFVAIAVMVLTAVLVVDRRLTGLGGRALRQRRLVSIVVVTAYVAIFVFEGALKSDGFGNQVAFGIWAACGPVLVLGPLVAVYAAQREDWPLLGVGLAMTLVAAGAAFAGPAGSWAIIALGCGLAFLAQALVELVTR